MVTLVLLGHTSLGNQDLGKHVPRNMSDGGPKPLVLLPEPLRDLLPLSPGVCCCCSSCPPVTVMRHWWKRPHYVRIWLAILLGSPCSSSTALSGLCNLSSFPDFRKLFPWPEEEFEWHHLVSDIKHFSPGQRSLPRPALTEGASPLFLGSPLHLCCHSLCQLGQPLFFLCESYILVSWWPKHHLVPNSPLSFLPGNLGL